MLTVCHAVLPCLFFPPVSHQSHGRSCSAHTQPHIHLTALCPGLPGWASTRKVKPVWILLKQETVSGSGISWVVCKSAPRVRQITLPAPHHSVFFKAGCSSCRPTNSVRALKAIKQCKLQVAIICQLFSLRRLYAGDVLTCVGTACEHVLQAFLLLC